MRRLLAAATIVAVGMMPVAAQAAPADEEVRYTSFNTISCHPDQDDAEEPPAGRLSYSVISLPTVHQYSTGEDVRIGLLDSGINPSHISLTDASIDEGVDFTGSEGGARSDSFGSGTTYASILAGSSDGRYPIRGIAPDSTLVPIKVIDRVPETMTQSYIDQTAGRLAEGIDWAVDNDIDVAVTALALPRGSAALEEAVARAEAAGILIVAPVGDVSGDSDDLETGDAARRYPAAYDGVLVVTAVNSTGGAVPGVLIPDRIDIASPGQNVPLASNSSNSTTCVAAKTQPSSLYAAVNAAGVAALVVSAHPDESPASITHRIEVTGVRPQFNRTATIGWGIINPAGAIHFIDDGTAHGPTSPDHGAPAEIEIEGREVLTPDPDPQRVTKPVTYVGLAAGGALALFMLLGAAGLWRRM